MSSSASDERAKGDALPTRLSHLGAPARPVDRGAAHPSSPTGPAAASSSARRVHLVNPSVDRASSVVFSSLRDAREQGAGTQQGLHGHSTYGTVATNTTFALREAIEAVEGAGTPVRAALMPSGLSAISTALLAWLKPGDHLLMSDSVYGPARHFANTMLLRFGIETEFFDPCIGAGIEKLIRPETRIVYLESPGSYTFEIQDVPAICSIARAAGVLTMIDNTYASPTLARPFEWGIDVSLLALTKYWCGHADVLMGAAVCREEHWPALWAAVRETGVCVGGDDAWLVLRGMRTADIRMRQSGEAGLVVGRWLESRDEVARVLNPGLTSHPQHELFRRDFLGSNGLLSFELAPIDGRAPTPAQVAALCEGRRHFSLAYSWGGFESLIMPADLSSFRSVKAWDGGPLIRVHCGLESPQDLIDDLAEGFAAMKTRAVD